MPEVTACPRPKGLPIARTKSPTSSDLLSPIGTAVRFSVLICRTAMSVGLSRPTRRARNPPAVLRRDLDERGAAHNMLVGEDIAVFCVDDDARARGSHLAAQPFHGRSKNSCRTGSPSAGTSTCSTRRLAMLTTPGDTTRTIGATVSFAPLGRAAGEGRRAKHQKKDREHPRAHDGRGL